MGGSETAGLELWVLEGFRVQSSGFGAFSLRRFHVFRFRG